MMYSRKSQAAMEFLMTYGWAVLAVLIILLTFIYFGTNEPEAALPDSAELNTNIDVIDTVANENSVTFIVHNSQGVTIRDFQIKAAACGGEEAFLSEPITLNPDETKMITIPCDDAESVGKKLKSDLEVKYKTREPNSNIEVDHAAVGGLLVSVADGKTCVPRGSMIGSGTEEDPYQICDCDMLQEMNKDVAGNYIITQDINCAETINWTSQADCSSYTDSTSCQSNGCGWIAADYCENQGCAYNYHPYYCECSGYYYCCESTWILDGSCVDFSGFMPIGNSTYKFTGALDGQNHSITGLYINRSTKDYIGLFSYTSGEIKNIALNGINFEGRNYVGGLAAYNYNDISGALIHNSSVTGTIRGKNYIGCIVGFNYGPSYDAIINDSHTDCTIYGNYMVGGFVGYNYGAKSKILSSYADGSIYMNGDGSKYYVGGLVGNDYYGAVYDSYSNVDVNGYYYVGGLIGRAYNAILIYNSYATGDVNGSNNIGGLFGYAYNSKAYNTFSTSHITSSSTNRGGLVGYASSSVYLYNSFWYDDPTDSATVCIGYGTPTVNQCTKKSDLSYFLGDVYPYNQPYQSWDFDTKWKETDDSYPVSK